MIKFNPFLTIVTRHFIKRPKLFKKCCNSVQMQKNKDFEHIIIKDEIGIGSLQANSLLYDNRKRITGDYVFILDDDNTLVSDDFAGDMKELVQKYNPDIIFIRMLIEGILYPTPLVWKASELTNDHVDTSCVVIRNNLWQENIIHFISVQIGDFWFINTIFKTKPKIYWQDKIYCKAEKSSSGKPE